MQGRAAFVKHVESESTFIILITTLPIMILPILQSFVLKTTTHTTDLGHTRSQDILILVQINSEHTKKNGRHSWRMPEKPILNQLR